MLFHYIIKSRDQSATIAGNYPVKLDSEIASAMSDLEKELCWYHHPTWFASIVNRVCLNLGFEKVEIAGQTNLDDDFEKSRL